ncbi:S8 family serine peptidase [Castellaniella sp.]|uniref:S8 family serine peptidase n=1 Tax=Castellaniella sp. TaxID=1955812 RepID=UPI003C76622D
MQPLPRSARRPAVNAIPSRSCAPRRLSFVRQRLFALLAGLGMSVAAQAAPGGFLFDPAGFEDAEFRRSGTLEQIGAQYAYARGYTGKGVLVAVLDSGLYARHPEFAGRVAGGWNFRADQRPWDYADTDLDDDTGWIEGHGTHVAGIIGAARDGVQMQGVAYEASLLGLRTDFDRDWTAFDYAIRAGARVLNGSYGPDGTPPMMMPDPANPDGPAIHNPGYWGNIGGALLQYQNVQIQDLQVQADMLRRAAAADIVMVFAAGNDYQNYPAQASHVSGYGMYHLITPDFFLARPGGVDPMFRFWDSEAPGTDVYDPGSYVILDFTDSRVSGLDFSDLGGSMLSVVSVGPSGTIASYSNHCGQAALWCLAAPGGDGGASDDPVWSTNPDPRNGYYVKMDGTSMASPVVAGAAAVLRQAFPYMSARQIIEVILTTTNDGGIYADHDVYGRGLLDLDKAVRGPGEFGADGFAAMFRADTRGYDSWFGNDIEGTGGLVKAGAGALILDGHNTYSGDTVVEGGRLSVNGNTASSRFSVLSDGTLGGTGTVGPVEAFGRVAPGNSIGMLTVAGDYVQAPGSVLEIEIDGAGNADRLDVQGNADLQGGEVQVLGLRGGSLGRTMTFMTVGGTVSGPGLALRSDYVFADLALVQPVSTQFDLTVTRNATSFASLGRTDNQRGAAASIESMGAGAVPYEALIDLRDAELAPGLYDQLSGELHATVRAMLFEDVRLARGEVMGRLAMDDGPSSAAGASSTARGGNGLWGRAVTGWSRHDGAGIAQDADRRASGLLIGRDVSWHSGARAGVALGYTRSRVRAEASNEAQLDGYHALAYGGLASGRWRLRGGVGQSWHVADTRREVAVAGLGRQTARYSGWTTQVFAQLGYARALGAVEVEPYAEAAQAWQSMRGFDEAGDAALSGRSGRSSSTETTLGVRTGWALATSAGDLRLMAGAGWIHGWGGLAPQARLAYAGGPAFDVSGVPAARDALKLEARASLMRTQATRVEIGYAGRVGGGVRDHGLHVQVNHAF